MIAVGIDISKGKSTVAILNSDGSIRIKPYEMPHTKPDLDTTTRISLFPDVFSAELFPEGTAAQRQASP